MISESTTQAVKAAGMQAAMRAAGWALRLLPIPQPNLLVGPGSSARLGQAVAGFGHQRLMIVTDAVVAKLGLLQGLCDALQAGGAQFVVFDEITPDAPIPLIERGIAFFKQHQCDAIVAVGGGSSMDASKAIAAAIANPGRDLRALAGYLKGRRKPMPLYAVPTTAGTGSEVTVAAVIADPQAKSKIVIVDPRLVPRMAALDPSLMTGLPPHITAATGMDALTHAVEAYVGHWASAATDAMALSAVGMIFEHLPRAYRQGNDLEAREKMALASTYAGLAFTRANVGYVHAIAHQFGGRYHTPHGLANAIMLPKVLRFSSPSITQRLAELAIRANLGQQDEGASVLADKFIDAVEALNHSMGIPSTLEALQAADIPALARAACREAKGYPVPRYMTQQQCEAIIRQALPVAKESAAKESAANAQPKKGNASTVNVRTVSAAKAQTTKAKPTKAKPAKAQTTTAETSDAKAVKAPVASRKRRTPSAAGGADVT